VQGPPPPASPPASPPSGKKKKKKDKKKKDKKEKRSKKKHKKDKQQKKEKEEEDEWSNDQEGEDEGEVAFGSFQDVEGSVEVVEQLNEENEGSGENEKNERKKTTTMEGKETTSMKGKDTTTMEETTTTTLVDDKNTLHASMVSAIVAQMSNIGTTDQTEEITLVQIQTFFKACNDRLQRQDDSISRGEKVVRGIVKWNKKNKKDGGEGDVIDRQDVAAWLLRKFSNTPAILMSFHEVAVSM
jgi:hypothetical protein